MPVSLKTIAQQCGVSQQAVSNALRGAGRMTPDTRERILETAQQLGYRPNSSVRAMKSGRFGAVALLQSTNNYRSYLPHALLDGLHDELAQHGYHLIFTRVPDEKLESEGFMPKMLEEWACDGVLINYIHDFPVQLSTLIEKYHIPSVWINVRRKQDCVYPDDLRMARDATRTLLDLGHRRIAYADFSGPETLHHYSVRDRRRGYETTMRRAGCTPLVLATGRDIGYGQLPHVFRGWLQEKPRPTAVIAYSEAEVLSVMQAALALGVRIPEELSLLTFHHGNPLTYWLGSSYICIPEHQIAATAVQMLLQKLETPALMLPPSPVRGELVTGTTLGPPLE
jgi:LacI family transcriptional regulator